MCRRGNRVLVSAGQEPKNKVHNFTSCLASFGMEKKKQKVKLTVRDQQVKQKSFFFFLKKI